MCWAKLGSSIRPAWQSKILSSAAAAGVGVAEAQLSMPVITTGRIGEILATRIPPRLRALAPQVVSAPEGPYRNAARRTASAGVARPGQPAPGGCKIGP